MIDDLLIKLEDYEANTRTFAARSLGELGDRRAYDALAAHVTDREGGVAAEAIEALLKVDAAAASRMLVGLLNSSDKPAVAHLVFDLGRADIELFDPSLRPQLIDALIRVVQDEDSNGQVHATAMLGELHDPRSVEALVAALSGENETLRADAALALGDIGDMRAFTPLVTAFVSEAAPIHGINAAEYMAEALGTLDGKQAYDILGAEMIAKLDDDDAAVREYAAEGLAGFADGRALEALAGRVRDPKERVRMLACRGLSRFGEEGVKRLVQLLDDQDSDVRSRAAAFLGYTNDKLAVEPLIQALADPEVRSTALEALLKIDQEKADQSAALMLVNLPKPELLELFDTLAVIGRNVVSLQLLPVTITALLTLLDRADKEISLPVMKLLGEVGQINDERVVPSLMQLLDGQDDELRGGAIYALRQALFKLPFERLAILISDDDSLVRNQAISALGELGDYHAVDLLIPMLQDEDEDVRFYVVRALSQLGDQRAVEPLIASLRDVSPTIRFEMVRVLGSIGDERALPALHHLAQHDVSHSHWKMWGSVGRQAKKAIWYIDKRKGQNNGGL